MYIVRKMFLAKYIMKKITFMLVLATSSIYQNAIAQFTQLGTSPNWVTPDNIGIGLPAAVVPDAKIALVSGYTQTGGSQNVVACIGCPPPPPPAPCFITGQPALSIYWPNLDNCINCPVSNNAGVQCSNVVNPPNIFEIYANGQINTGSWNSPVYSWVKSPIFVVDPYGNTGAGVAPFTNNKFSVGGNAKIEGNLTVTNNTHFQKKFRINTALTFSAQDWNNTNFPYTFSVDNGSSRFLGKVQISAPITTTNLSAKKPITAAFNNYMLAVEGNIVCQKAIVQTIDWADYVFAPSYQLMPLQDVEKYIKANNHLPAMPNTATVVAEGQDVGQIQKMQQAKIEELTLYLIQLKKELDEVKGKISK
jgi:hypothetical protein